MINCRGPRKTGNANIGLEEWNFVADDNNYTDKKEKKISLNYKEIHRDRVQSHIWLTASLYMGISSYIKKPFLIYDFAPAPISISLYMR